MGIPVMYVVRPRFKWDAADGPGISQWWLDDVFCVLTSEELIGNDIMEQFPKLLFIGNAWQRMDHEARIRLFRDVEGDFCAMFDRWWILERYVSDGDWRRLESKLSLNFLASLKPTAYTYVDDVIAELMEECRKNRALVMKCIDDLGQLLESPRFADHACRSICQELISEIPEWLNCPTRDDVTRLRVCMAIKIACDANVAVEDDPVVQVVHQLNELLSENI